MEKQIFRTEKCILQCIFSALLLIVSISASSKKPPLKPRVVVLTDVSTWETDDSESLVRFLVHTDLFEIEGLIFTTGWSLDKTRDECAWKFQNGTGKSNWEEYATHIQNHGNLGKVYPKYKYGVEGDTPAFLHILPNGLNNPNEPTQAGWGGYSEWGLCEDNATYSYTNHKELAYNTCRKYEEHFYQATFNNFAARMDWAKEGKGNRNPIVAINKNKGIEILKENPRQGTSFTLDASKSYDPDGDKLTFKWWIQPEAGTYAKDITITNGNTSVVTIEVQAGSAGKTFHVICEVTDNGIPNLTSYRRIIFEPVE